MTFSGDALWDNGVSIADWAKEHTPDDNLIWKGGHATQARSLLSVECLMGMECRIIGSHTSKSVGLPVAIFKEDVCMEEKVYFITRDNFHDLKLVVLSSCPIEMDLGVVHRSMTPEQLVAEREGSREYCKTHEDFNAKDYETDKWFDDWCGDTLIRTEGKIFRSSSVNEVYYEGMERSGVPQSAFQRYERGRSEFATEIRGDYPELMIAMRTIRYKAIEFVMQRRRQEREKEQAEREQSKVGST